MTDVLEAVAGEELNGSLREKIKRGELDPTIAIEAVESQPNHSEAFVRWARGAGQARYDAAKREQAKAAEAAKVEEKKAERKRRPRKARRS